MMYNIVLILFFPIFISAQNDTCSYQLQLIDFFGDGWSGATISVVVKTDTTSYTLPDSTLGTFEIAAFRNERLQFFFSPGVFDEEIIYTIKDPSGEVIFNDGPSPSPGLALDLIACPSCPLPTTISANTTDQTALIAWESTENSSQYLLEYGAANFIPDNGIFLSTSDTFITIPDLFPFTFYEGNLTSICAAGDTSLNKLTFSFTTRYAKDVGVSEILVPMDGCDLSETETITFRLQNFGSQPQSFIPYNFSVNGMAGGVMMPNDGLFTNILSKDSSIVLSFENSYDFSKAGMYDLAIWTELAGDNQVSNDTAHSLIIVKDMNTSLTPLEVLDNFRLFPNPTKGTVQLEMSLAKPKKIELSIQNYLGQIVKKFPTIKSQALSHRLDFSSYTNGVYLLQIRLDNQLFSKKILLID